MHVNSPVSPLGFRSTVDRVLAPLFVSHGFHVDSVSHDINSCSLCYYDDTRLVLVSLDTHGTTLDCIVFLAPNGTASVDNRIAAAITNGDEASVLGLAALKGLQDPAGRLDVGLFPTLSDIAAAAEHLRNVIEHYVPEVIDRDISILREIIGQL